MITTLIFDLDNCLAPADEVGAAFFKSAFDAIRQKNNGRLSQQALELAFTDIWKHPYDWVAATHNFSDEMLTAGWNEFARLEMQQPLQGYGDLQILGEIPATRFLVTSGFRRLQESKVRSLRIESLFEKVIVDAIDEPGRIGKYGHFQKILQDYALQPSEVVVVGDNAESEIAAGNQLGMTTIQTVRPGVQKAISASGHVVSLLELKRFLQPSSDEG